MTRPSLQAHDEASERAALGAMLNDGSQWSDFATTVKRDDLFIERHKIVFDACAELAARGDAIDLVTVPHTLNGRLDSIGGAAYLMELSLACSVPWNWPSYAAAIAETAQERRRAIALLKAGKAIDRGDFSQAGQVLIDVEESTTAPEHHTGGLIPQFQHISIALEPRPAVRHLIEKHIPARSLIAGYGRPGAFKTMYFFDVAFSIASGQAHLVTEPPDMNGGLDVTQAPVLWCDVDSGMDELLDRARAFGRGRNLNLHDLPVHIVSFPDPPLNAARGLSTLIAAIQNFDAKFVALDNLLRIAGVPDENSPMMDTAMSALRGVVENTGATVLFIHHPSKNRAAGDVVDGDDLRGHSSILAAVDLALRVKRDRDIITIKATKSRRNMPEPIAARFAFTHQADGQTLDECRFFRAELPDAPANAQKIEARRAAICAALKAGPLSFNKLHGVVKGRRDDLQGDLSTLIDGGVIDVTNGPRSSQIYNLLVSM